MHIKLISLLYLDPGSGSFILQIVIAAALGGAYALKVYWKKIKKLFRGKAGEEELAATLDDASMEQKESDVQK